MAFAIPADLIPLLRSARRVAARSVTGAGVSKESGVPEPLFSYVHRSPLDCSADLRLGLDRHILASTGRRENDGCVKNFHDLSTLHSKTRAS